MPFCLYSFFVLPETAERFFAVAEPCRLLASCAFTAQAQLQGMTRADRKLLSAFLAQIEQTHGLRWPTGATFKRSISSGTYVEDPLGLDWPTYDVPWSRPTRASVVQALKERSNGE